MKKILISVHGFLGDIILSQPIAERLKLENQAYEIDFLIGFPQPARLLSNNPYIDNVLHYSKYIGPNTEQIAHSLKDNYDEVRYLKAYKATHPITTYYQLCANVQNPQSEYTVYTDYTLDKIAKEQLSKLDDRPKIGICNTWRATPFTDGIYYDTTELKQELAKKYNIVELGLYPDKNQYDGASENCENNYAYMASIAKHLDLIIGGEGGLTNLFAGVGTRILYTTDFTWFLAGPDGDSYSHPNPIEILGPKAYFPAKNHIFLPYSIKKDSYMSEIQKVLSKLF